MGGSSPSTHSSGRSSSSPTASPSSCCANETNTERLFGSPCTSFPKDGINDHVVEGAASVGGESGTKAAFWHEVTVAPGASATVRMRLRPPTDSNPWTDFDAVVADRLAEADEFYAE